MDRALNAFQVAALLVSASYGIGFLFGSGELAVSHGMAGSIYGLSTAFGMLLLAVFAVRLWRGGAPIWGLFGRAYGDGMKNTVALLSLVWMAGVLAAQIHGGVAIMKLLGLADWAAYGLVLAGIFTASRLNLRVASTVFFLFLLASGLVLVYAVISGDAGQIYMESPTRFVADLGTFRPWTAVSILIAVVALVCTGADYHQFVLAALKPSAALWGCILAGICLCAVSFLPASVVIGLQSEGGLAGLQDSKQVIPFALSKVASQAGSIAAGNILLLGLSAAALGSGAAIVRAMTSALAATTKTNGSDQSFWMTFVSLGIGAALASRGQGIVATMVSVNVIYIASIAWPFACLLAGYRLAPGQALTVVAVGFSASSLVYAASWFNVFLDDSDFMSLMIGLVASGLLIAKYWLCRTFRRIPT